MAVVLLVEDHSDTRVMLAEFLSDEFEVMQAADGEQALAAMYTRVPDLVITDLALPRVDGFELVLRMRADPVLAGVPVICISGYGGQALDQRARAAGCNCVLQKPCLPDTLVAAAADLLRERDRRKKDP